MSYTLIGSTTSPYVRKLRLCFHDKINYEFKSINYLEINDVNYLKSINPINKIPILIDNEETIFDSRVIFNHLTKKYSWTKLSLKEENILSAIDGLMDTTINLFLLKRGGLDLDAPNNYVSRQLERIPLIMEFLSPWASTMNDWNFLSMSLYSFLDWASFRGVLNLDKYPEMKIFLTRFEKAPGVELTKIIA
jgi:glutathione S-transferase